MGASFEISMAGEVLLPKAWIDRHLERGELFVMYTSKESRSIGVAVVTDENKGICELKNLAIHPAFQRKGFGMKLVNELCEHYKHRFHTMQAGTGDSKQTTSFYQRCGFSYSHTLENFFTDNYDHPIIEKGKALKNMIYFSKHLVSYNP